MKALLGGVLLALVAWGFLGATRRDFLPHVRAFFRAELSVRREADWQLRLGHMDMWRLQMASHEAQRFGFLVDEAKEWVRGQMVRGSEIHGVRVRLRGDLPKHWSSSKKSYRLRFDEPSPWLGMFEVDLILPSDKGGVDELAAYTLGRELGLLVPRAGFTTLDINGVAQGCYFWRQGYGADFFELAQRPESSIFRENNIWLWGVQAAGPYPALYGTAKKDTTLIHLWPHLYGQLYKGPADAPGGFGRFARFLEVLRTGDGDLREFLNLRAYYRWLALVVEFGSVHATLPDNLGWYLNTATGLFEPLLYDVLPERVSVDALAYLRSKSKMLDLIVARTWLDGGREEYEAARDFVSRKHREMSSSVPSCKFGGG